MESPVSAAMPNGSFPTLSQVLFRITARIPTVALPEIATAKQIERPKKEGNMEKLRPKRISRTEFYVRVWQTPMTRLDLELGISGNGLVMIA